MKHLIAAACLAAAALACSADPDTATDAATTDAAASDASVPDAAPRIDAAGPVTPEPVPADWVGSWTLVEVWATPTEGPFAGETIAGHGDGRCVRLGWDQALSGYTIAADGHFVGPFISDSVEDWRGALVAPVNPEAAPGARALRVDVCHFCYDHDTEIGKLGHVVVVDGHLELTRTAHLEFDEDGESCALCTAEGDQFPEGRASWSAQLRLRYAPAPGPGSTQSMCYP